MISIIIPIYPPNEDPKHIENMVKTILSYEGEKEVILRLEPFLNKDWEELIKKLSKYANVRIFVNPERYGKRKSCNEAAKTAKGKYLLFIDADVFLPSNRDFLKKIISALEKYDYLDIVKELIPSNLFGKIMYYEYLGMNIFQYLSAKYLQKLYTINGAFVAVKKDLFLKLGGFGKFIIEDVEFATRLALNNKKATFLNLKIWIEPLESFKRWVDQRKRWAYGFAEYLKFYWKHLIKNFLKHKKDLSILIFMLIYNPAVLSFLIFFLIPQAIWLKISSLALFLLSVKLTPIIYILIPLIEIANFLKNIVLVILAYTITAAIYYYFARKFNMKFNILYFTLYYFVYAPIWLLIVITVLIGYFIFEKEFKIDWKV